MRLSFNKSDLLNGINIVLKAVPSKTTMPILECILVDATKGDIKLASNDMEMAIETKVTGTILEEGRTAIDAKLFSEIIRKLPDSEVLLEADGNDNIRISCEKANFNISGRNGEDFAFMPVMEKKEYICISQFTMKEIIRQTIFSIAANENNKLMTGELFEIDGNSLQVVSLDGHRISIRNVELRDHYEKKKVIVPGKTLIDISRILPGDKDSDVYIFFGKNHILFEFDQTVVLSRLIEGEYFKIEQMISSDYETKITLNKKDLLEAIERSILLVRESDKKPIILNIKDGNMELSLNSVIGSMHEEMMIHKSGKDIMIGFNPRFLLDALRVIDDEEIKIYMVNSKAPCFIRDDEQSYIYLILPVNFTAPRA